MWRAGLPSADTANHVPHTHEGGVGVDLLLMKAITILPLLFYLKLT